MRGMKASFMIPGYIMIKFIFVLVILIIVSIIVMKIMGVI